MSGLYFRGKLTYARRFAAPPEPGNPVVGGGVHVITPNAGLRTPETRVTSAAFETFAGADVHPDNAAYRRPLEQSARALARELGGACDVVLLGSIASPKYVDVLLDDLRRSAAVPDRVRRPRRHEPRRTAAAASAPTGVELDYVPIAGAVAARRAPAEAAAAPANGDAG